MAEAGNQITREVETFLRRAIPHFLAGNDVEASFRAVLDDDARIFNAALDRGGNLFFPTPDERGRVVGTGLRRGDLIASALASEVYAQLTPQVKA